jgi:hypothetical protein
VTTQELHVQLQALGVTPLAPVPVPPKRFTWPAQLSGLGIRRLGVFTGCGTCGLGSWVQYGDEPLCWACAGRAAANWVNLDKNSDKNSDKKAGVALSKLLNLDLDAEWLDYAQAAGLDEAVTNAGLEALQKAEP